MSDPFSSEAEMVQCWLDQFARNMGRSKAWTVYAETAGWDLLLVHSDGFQLGIEAKLSLNAKVLAQALKDQHSLWRDAGPDYRAVLVPEGKCQNHLSEIAAAIGIRILKARPQERGVIHGLSLPDERYDWTAWPNWCPTERCSVPDYIPDVRAGHKSPVMLTPWKVKAIKLMILLERRGRVCRGDMKALGISPSRWTDSWNGFLSASAEAGGYVQNKRTPDLKAQHPENWVQIEADFKKWCPPGYLMEAA